MLQCWSYGIVWKIFALSTFHWRVTTVQSGTKMAPRLSRTCRKRFVTSLGSCCMAFPQNFARSSAARMAESTGASHRKEAQVLVSARINSSTRRIKWPPSCSPLPRTKRNNVFSKTCLWHILLRLASFNLKLGGHFLEMFSFLFCEMLTRTNENKNSLYIQYKNSFVYN